MFLVPELGVYNHPEDLDVTFGLNKLAFNSEGLRVSLVRLASEVDDRRLFCFKCRPASPFPV